MKKKIKIEQVQRMKKAFTMMEFVFVIVIIAILTVAILPRIESNSLREAAIQVISHIRYTQHLAMVDDQYDANDANWFKGRWQIRFGSSAYTNNEMAYAIFLDDGAYDGNPNLSELAIDPIHNGRYLSGGWSGILYTSDERANKDMNIGLTYDIANVGFAGGCASVNQKRLTFDHLGRPLWGTVHSLNRPYEANKIIQRSCEIILTNSSGDSVTIAIEPETGYAHIL